MKFAVLILVVLGLVASGCAAVLVAALSGRSDGGGAVSTNTDPEIEVLLASSDLLPMTVVDSAAVTTKRMRKSQIPQNALLSPVLVVGKVITDRMVAGQMFTRNCFPREGAGVYLATAVPPGKRAMSISLNDWSCLAGLLYPGSVVDVLVSFKTLGVEGKRGETEMMSTTLLQGLQVLAIGAQSIAEGEYQDKNPGALSARGQINFRMVTLLVDAKQAEILQLAMQNGSISLAMRNPLDASREARRLTRAREIAPGRNMAPVTSAGDDRGTDPFEQAAENSKAGSDGSTPGTGGHGVWETVIIRGSVPEKRTFPMPEAPNQPTDPKSEPAASGAAG
jgi:pilus assembly protein CpaB